MVRGKAVGLVVMAAAAGASCGVSPPASPATGTSPVRPDSVAAAREVTLAWLARWCPFDWREPINANVEKAGIFQTPQGKAADLAAGDTDRGYRALRDQQLAGTCDQLDAVPSPAAPAAPDLVFMIATARRVLLADGRQVQVETVSTTRRVVRAGGRWLVYAAAEVG